MFTIYYADGIPYGTTWDELEAEIMAYNIGGFYVASKEKY